MSILDLSKTLMYDFHYEYIRTKCDHADLLFTDTERPVLPYNAPMPSIKTCSPVQPSLTQVTIHPTIFYIPRPARKCWGKWRTRQLAWHCRNLWGCSARCTVCSMGAKKTAKGIGRSHIRKMRHAEYKDSLLKKMRSIATTNMIRSYEHRVYSEHVTKVALSSFDDKRYVLENGYSTLAHGHCRINSV